MLRVRVEIVPWGREDLTEEIAVLNVGRDNGDEGAASRFYSAYRVELLEPGKAPQEIGKFKLHRYGWYRNRLGLAARALKMLQLRRDRGKFLPYKEPFANSTPYQRTDDHS